LHHEPGWFGLFCRNQEPGCYPNGTRVVKLPHHDRNDAHKPGDKATVLGSISHPLVGVGYFVAWDDAPRLATFVIAAKIARL
jgi:hypothetical protein